MRSDARRRVMGRAHPRSMKIEYLHLDFLSKQMGPFQPLARYSYLTLPPLKKRRSPGWGSPSVPT